MYLRNICKHGNCIERIEYHTARYKCTGMKKKITGKPTPERQQKYKVKCLERKTWRLLDENFKPGDLWVTFTFTKENRPDSPEQAKKIIQNFKRHLRKLYKRAGLELKYILVCGVGSKGAYHVHAVLNEYSHWHDIATLWQRCTNNGEYVRVNFEPLHKMGQLIRLAWYIVKNGQEDYKRTKSIFGRRITYSKNLKMPKEQKTKIKKDTWRKHPPIYKGYYIDKNLSYEGIDLYGYPYRYLVYVKIDTAPMKIPKSSLA